jgi:hypothetical protein
VFKTYVLQRVGQNIAPYVGGGVQLPTSQHICIGEDSSVRTVEALQVRHTDLKSAGREGKWQNEFSYYGQGV